MLVPLRGNYQRIRETLFLDTPLGSFGPDSPPPGRAFVAFVAGARRAKNPTGAVLEAVVADHREPIPCRIREPERGVTRPAVWVWDATPQDGIAWGRITMQDAILAGDGRRVTWFPCFPEREPIDPPREVLLVHGLEDDRNGAVARIEDELRARGWNQTRFLRPSLGRIPEAEVRADPLGAIARAEASLSRLLAAAKAHPELAIGVGAGGVLAARTAAPWRMTFGVPWAHVSQPEREAIALWPGLTLVHGSRDDIVPTEESISAMIGVRRRLHPMLGHDFERSAGLVAACAIDEWGFRPVRAKRVVPLTGNEVSPALTAMGVIAVTFSGMAAAAVPIFYVIGSKFRNLQGPVFAVYVAIFLLIVAIAMGRAHADPPRSPADAQPPEDLEEYKAFLSRRARMQRFNWAGGLALAGLLLPFILQPMIGLLTGPLHGNGGVIAYLPNLIGLVLLLAGALTAALARARKPDR